VNYGFLIRNDRCIGCHACSTACKAENQVPLGVHRTWVKTVETGSFPDVGRHFQVTRCNHCARPPCVEICPTRAMYRRSDGIVEFDPDLCIGCKACLQACPYDAIHIDPSTGTAAKCHFCAHRVEVGMEPPCVVVCPEHAIIAGDLDDADSEISRMLATYSVTVRKPEQGTRPKLFYVEGDAVTLNPGATDPDPVGYAWSESSARGASSDSPKGPIRIGEGRVAGEMVRTAWDVQHRVPWHWPVPAYLVTKAISAGLMLLLAGGVLTGLAPFDAGVHIAGGLLALVFLAATTVLLVADLERPERFIWVLLKSHSKSWLVRGAWVLIAFGTLTGAWWALEAGGALGWLDPGWPAALRNGVFLVTLPLAGLAAAYTAFLFGQAEGRDLWQSPLLPAHLVLQALGAGAGGLLVLNVAVALPGEWLAVATGVLVAAIVLDLVLFLPGEFAMRHGTDGAREAAKAITRGAWRRHFWGGSVILGHLVPLALLAGAPFLAGASFLVGGAPLAPSDPGVAGPLLVALLSGPAALPALGALAGAASIAGLYAHEYAFVMAPQRVRNS
jgi:Fe-S-cluster-containing dehydrogenase component/formate-dependent nitrite reductase membrane component NrfD